MVGLLHVADSNALIIHILILLTPKNVKKIIIWSNNSTIRGLIKTFFYAIIALPRFPCVKLSAFFSPCNVTPKPCSIKNMFSKFPLVDLAWV